MNLEGENNKELNLLTPLLNIINSILSLKQQKVFKNHNNNSEGNQSNILHSFKNEINYCFKVLILDDPTFKFVSPLLKQSSLRKNNICLTIKLNSQKDIMNDVMAIYLVTPSSTNFKLILDDMKSNIYQNYSLNFIEKPDDNLLDEFLTDIIKIDKYKQIYNLHVFPIKYSLIHPKIIDFCSLDNSLEKPYSLINLNLNNNKTENYYDLISNMLFNCLFCMRVSPLIKFRKGSFIELIVNKIQTKFISTFNKFPKLQQEFKNSNCLMILLERDYLDIPIMLHHSSGFGAIINDICGITFEQPNQILSTNNNNIKKFILDPLNDFIWDKEIIKFYHEVGEEMLLRYKKYVQQMKILDEGNDKQNINLEDLANKSEKIAESIKNIDTKKIEGDILYKHANIYPILNKNIEQRHLAEIYLIEKTILDRREINKEINEKINSMINEKKISKDNYLDMFRLCLIYFLISKDSTNDKFIKEIIDKLSLPAPFNSKAIIENFEIIKNGEKVHSSEELMSKLNEEQKSNTMLRQVGGATKYLFKKGFNFLKSAYTNLTYSDRPSSAINILNNLIYNKYEQEFSSYQVNEEIYTPISSTLYKNIFLFTLGGGSLNEFEYCKEYMDKYRFNFIYGADKIYSPIEFLGELNELSINSMKKN